MQPRLGDGEVEENILGIRFGIAGFGQRMVRGIGLLVEELAADLALLVSQPDDTADNPSDSGCSPDNRSSDG
jgi:hypothetical protein